MLVIDTKSVVKDRNSFSRGVRSTLGSPCSGTTWNMRSTTTCNWMFRVSMRFWRSTKGEAILLFGFTFMIWAHFYEALKKAGLRLSLDNGIMIHGGGWKKLADQAVDSATFRQRLHDVCGISRVYNYYGMVEQTGSIYMECEAGHLHSSIFSDIFIRDYRDFKSLPTGQEGLVQLVSLLPLSYSGHSILSEDVGVILGEDDCSCGRLGKYFEIRGRIKNAEVRGCSDAYAASA